jgi:hypothetical protein
VIPILFSPSQPAKPFCAWGQSAAAINQPSAISPL